MAEIEALASRVTLRGASPPRSIPLTRSLGLLLVDVEIEGMDGARPFVLDTGAPFAIAPELARAGSGRPAGLLPLRDPLGRRGDEPLVVLPRVSLGDVELRDVLAVSLWPGPPNPLACLSRAGLFGVTALRAGLWQVDFAARRLRVAARLEDLDVSGAVVVPFVTDANGVPFVELRLGAWRGRAAIDLGSNRFIEAPLEVVQRAGARLEEGTPRVLGSPVTTVYGTPPTELLRPTVGPIDVGDGAVRLTAAPVWTSEATAMVLIGVDFLEHFVMTVDWPRRRLYLAQRSAPTIANDERPTLGFFAAYREGAIAVSSLWRGGAAELAGVELGDRLLAVDGHRLEGVGWEAYCDLVRSLGDRSDDAPTSVEIGRGLRRVSLELRPARWPPGHERDPRLDEHLVHP